MHTVQPMHMHEIPQPCPGQLLLLQLKVDAYVRTNCGYSFFLLFRQIIGEDTLLIAQ
jgi:hypothetical protein